MRNSRCGFSLIEMAVVLAVLILLAAMIVPTIGPLRRQGRMRVGAATVAEALRLARSLAIAHSSVYKLDFETFADPHRPDEVRIYSGTGDRNRYDRLEKLPEAVRFKVALPPDGTVCFYPDGSCPGNFTIRIQDAGTAGAQKDQRTIEVKAASGRVSVSGGAR